MGHQQPDADASSGEVLPRRAAWRRLGEADSGGVPMSYKYNERSQEGHAGWCVPCPQCEYEHDRLLAQLAAQAQRVSDVIRCRDVQGQPGNWDYDEYMRGLYNGLELAAATLEDREPVYRDAPDDAARQALTEGE